MAKLGQFEQMRPRPKDSNRMQTCDSFAKKCAYAGWFKGANTQKLSKPALLHASAFLQ